MGVIRHPDPEVGIWVVKVSSKCIRGRECPALPHTKIHLSTNSVSVYEQCTVSTKPLCVVSSLVQSVIKKWVKGKLGSNFLSVTLSITVPSIDIEVNTLPSLLSIYYKESNLIVVL